MSKNASKVLKKFRGDISKYPDGKFKELTSIISKTKVEGKEFINDQFIKKYIDENIMGISSHLK